MLMVSLFVLLLFHLSLGQENSPAAEVADAALDPCQCETRTFNEDEMNGTLKFFHNTNCTNFCTYKYFISPRPGYIVSLEDKVISTDPQAFSTFYYTGELRETEMVPMGYSDIVAKGSETPPGIGVYIKYKRPRLPSDYDFDFSFERIPVAELKKMCPQPVLNVTSTAQTIDAAAWPKRGCSLRLQSEHPIIIRGDIDAYGFTHAKLSFLQDGTTLMLMPKIATPIVVNEDGRVDGLPHRGYIKYTVEPKTDLLYRPVLLEEEPKNLTVVSLDYDPCNCSDAEINIEAGQTFNLKVDDMKARFCPQLNCIVTLNLTKKADEDYMNTFVIETLKFSRTTFVRLEIDGDLVDLEKWFGQDHMNILAGEKMKIYYSIYSPSSDPTFSMNVTAVTQPHDCRCPSNYRKHFIENEGSLEMTIPPYCTHMMCHLALHVPRENEDYWNTSPRMDQVLHMGIDYQFHNEILHITGEHELMLHSASRRETFTGDLLSNNSEIMVTYLRQGVRQGLNETSQFKMNWHWVTLNECSCGKTSLAASSKWSAIYSPRYPQEYCTNLNCTYIVEAPEGHHVKFVVSQLETEPHRDILSIFESNKTLLQLSGHQPNYTMNVDTEGQKAMVTFHSDDTVTAKGFKLSYIAIPDVDYVPEALTGGYSQGFVIVGAILLLTLLIALCIFLVYKRNFFKRSIPPVYSFLPKSDEVIVIDVVDKE